MILALPNWQSFRPDFRNLAGIFNTKFLIWITITLAVGVFVFVAGVFLTDTSAAAAIGPVSTKILDRNGVLLYEIHGETKRTVVNLDEISPYLINATIAAEDEQFYSHQGVSLSSMARAAWVDIKMGKIEQGGSTITQQLVKNSLLSREKTFERKLKEVILAVKMELQYSKEEILNMYMNSVPYGRNAYGSEAAALSYFAKSAKDLTLAESAYLASLPKAPSYLSPFGSNSEELEVRKDYILDRMLEHKFITETQRDEAKKEKVSFYYAKTSITAPYFVKMVEESLTQAYGRDYLETAGLEVYTSLDINLQKEAEEAIRIGTDRNKRANRAYNASLVAMNPKTGEILAFVGGKDYFGEAEPAGCISGLNCKFDPKVNTAIALRQPGSSFKPYTYVTAFSPEFGFTPSTKVLDQRTNFSVKGATPYIPKNYNGRNYGLLPMRRALAGSLNVAAVRTLSMVGVDSVRNTAEEAGITTPMENCGLSLTLGACEVKLLDHVAGFATLANMGLKVEPTAIIRMNDSMGREVAVQREQPKQVIDPRAAYLVVDVMKDNSARSFIFGPRSPLILPDRPVAAKTGTSQNFRDGWTVGFTPSLAVGVWTGNNDSTYMRQGADGVVTAGPIWNQFMKAATKGTPAEEWEMPEGVQKVKVSARSGLLATEFTPDPVMEVFADYSVPKKKDTYRPPEPTPEDLAALPLPDGAIPLPPLPIPGSSGAIPVLAPAPSPPASDAPISVAPPPTN